MKDKELDDKQTAVSVSNRRAKGSTEIVRISRVQGLTKAILF